MTIGIYGIFHGELCLYVGQSVDIEKRWSTHRGKLLNGSHRSDFNLYFSQVLERDASRLELRILSALKERDPFKLSELEVEYFRKHRPRFYGQEPSLTSIYLKPSRGGGGADGSQA